MSFFQKIIANAIIGAIIGSTLLLPYLGWVFSGHGMIEFDWTIRFLIVGVVWGIVCGITIGLVPIMINSSEIRRIITGMSIGGLGGIIFYLIGDLAFISKDSLSTILFKSLWGLGIGVFGGGICTLVLGKLNRLLMWNGIRDDSSKQSYPGNRLLTKEKVLSAIIGLNAGSFVGNFLLVFFGQAIIVLFGTIYFNEILLLYFLPLIFGCFTAGALFMKPLKKQLVNNILAGVRNGTIFGLLFFLYFIIVSLLVTQLSVAKPELMTDSYFLGFVSSVVVVFTAIFSLVHGISVATFEGFLLERKAKKNNAA